jgi:general secretion pathway protein G
MGGGERGEEAVALTGHALLLRSAVPAVSFSMKRRRYLDERLLRVGLMLVAMAIVVALLRVTHQERSGPGRELADIRSMSDALETYRLDIGHYPTTAAGLDALIRNVEGSKRWIKPYLNRVPLPSWGGTYRYSCPGPNGKEFEIVTVSPEGHVITSE